MEEEKQTPVNSDNGGEPQANDIIKQADDARKGLEEAIKKREELLKREQELEARRMISGRSEAGITAKQQDPETELKQKVNKLFEGTKFKPWP